MLPCFFNVLPYGRGMPEQHQPLYSKGLGTLYNDHKYVTSGLLTLDIKIFRNFNKG